MLKSRILAWATAIICAGAGLVVTSAQAADQTVKIGVVDIEKVYSNAPRVKQYNEQLAAFRQELSQKLDIRNQNRMLNESEIEELIKLKTQDKRTPADDARIKELEGLERSRDAELKTLQGTKEPDEQQKAKLKELQDMQQKSNDTGNALLKDYDGQLQTRMQELMGKAETDVREVISKIAGEKGFTMVLAKDPAVLFGGIDISDDVIKNLDRKMQ